MVVQTPRPRYGAADHGRAMSLAEFTAADWDSGSQYELIDGRVYVSPEANLPHDRLTLWLMRLFIKYLERHPEVCNYLSVRSRVFVHSRRLATCPQPDFALFQDGRIDDPDVEIGWEDLSPFLVAEIISPGDAAKDLVRNVALYLEVPSIREYWVLDPRLEPRHPTLTVYRRRGQRWQKPIVVEPGQPYETKLLPGCTLLVPPRKPTAEED